MTGAPTRADAVEMAREALRYIHIELASLTPTPQQAHPDWSLVDGKSAGDADALNRAFNKARGAYDALAALDSIPDAGDVTEEYLREKLTTAYRRFGGIRAIARSETGPTKIISIAIAEFTATLREREPDTARDEALEAETVHWCKSCDERFPSEATSLGFPVTKDGSKPVWPLCDMHAMNALIAGWNPIKIDMPDAKSALKSRPAHGGDGDE